MPRRDQTHLEADPASVARARSFVAATLAAWDLDDLTEVALLLTSEVVTNAVRHAKSAFTVTVSTVPPKVTVEVSDNSPAAPTANLDTHDEESGRGLHLVDSLARQWGWRPVDGGKVVWFTLAG